MAISLCCIISCNHVCKEPVQIRGIPGQGVNTTDKRIICELCTCGDPNLIQCHITVAYPLTQNLEIFLTVKKDGTKALISVPIKGRWTDKEHNTMKFDFALEKNIIPSTELYIFGNNGRESMELKLKSVDIISGKIGRAHV